MSDPQQDYADAKAVYLASLDRLLEAKRHIPPSPRDLRKQRQREQREAERARLAEFYSARDPTKPLLTVEMITAKALAILHHKVNALGAVNRQYDSLAEEPAGDSMRIRMPISYTVKSTSNE